MGEQGVGEILDRVDDDTHDVGTLARRQVWSALRTVFAALPMWVVAGATWWPAWFLFPAMAAVVWFAVRSLLPDLTRRKIVEEVAWTDHATAFEEGIAARDDLRTSLGQAYVVRRASELAAVVHERLRSVVQRQIQVTYRTGLLLHGLLAGVGVVGVALVLGDGLTVARLVTLFLVTTLFVGQVEEMARHLPDLQAGLGALVRLRQLHEAEREPTDGAPVPDGAVEVRFTGLDFTYAEGTFRLVVDDLVVPAGETLALVGRSGSGKSTLAALVSRAQEPPRGACSWATRTCASSTCRRCGARSGWSRSAPRSWPAPSRRTSRCSGTCRRARSSPRSPISGWRRGWQVSSTASGRGSGRAAPRSPRGGAAGGLRPVARPRRAGGGARRGDGAHGPADRDARRARGRPAPAGSHRPARRAPPVHHRAGLPRRRALRRPRGAAGHAFRARAAPGPFRDLLDAAEEVGAPLEPAAALEPAATGIGAVRRRGAPPESRDPGPGPSLARGIWNALLVRPWWGLFATALFLVSALAGAFGAVSAFLWGRIVQEVAAGEVAVGLLVGLVVSLLLGPVLLNEAMRRYPRWWIEILLRVRTNVLLAQTDQHRLPRDPRGRSRRGRWTRTASRGTPTAGSTSRTPPSSSW
ncbi:ATP-binding cassette domain-containing protein [Nocardioides zeae]